MCQIIGFRSYSFLIPVSLMFLIACGGGGGNNDNPAPDNQAPSVNAGPDQSVDEQSNVTLSGSASDADGTVTTILWTQTQGTSVTLNDTSILSPSFLSPAIDTNQTLIFKLSVTDNDGLSANDTVSINLIANLPPVVNAGDDQTVDEQSNVTLSGSASDSDGTITTILWTQTQGTVVTLSDNNILNPSFTAPDIETDEVLTFQLSVADNDGDTSVDGVSISLTAISPPANFSLTITPPISMQTGTNNSALVDVIRNNGHNGSISLSLATNASAISGTGSIDPDSSSGTLTLTVPVTVAAGVYSLTLDASDGTITQSILFDLKVTAQLNIDSNSALAIASINSAYQVDLMASGGEPTYNWSIIAGSLPPTFSLSATGHLSGTATTVGSYSFTLQILDSLSATSSKIFNLDINGFLLTTLESNGSFEQGLSGWNSVGSGNGVQYTVVNDSIDGANGVRVINRTQATDSPRQNVFSANLANAAGTPITSHFWVKLDMPAQVRLKLMLTSDIGSGQTSTASLILAEQVIRTADQWTEVSGTQTINWSGTLTSASILFDIGQPVENVYPGFTLDYIQIKRDADLDGLFDVDEAPANANNADHDNDGLPDDWETMYLLADLLDPDVSDANLDADSDGYSNREEYWAATNPLDPDSIPGVPSTVGANANVVTLTRTLALLPSQNNNRIISGQHLTGSPSLGGIAGEYASNVQALFDQTGKWPGILSLQYEGADAATGPLQVNLVNPFALDWANNGGLVLIKFQPFDPWTLAAAGPAGGAYVDLVALLDPSAGDPADLDANTAANALWLDWLDQMATGLDELQQAGITVMWRPQSEMNNAAHWQSRQPRTAWIALWRHMHEYFTIQRGLKNLIWVYESDSVAHALVAADYYYPGDDVVDLMGHNLYDDDWVLPYDLDKLFRSYPKSYGFPQAGSQAVRDGSWDNMIMINGIKRNFPRTSLFCTWNDFYNGGNVFQARSMVSQMNASALLEDDWVLTRDEID